MKEIFARLFSNPAIAFELIVATVFANVLVLATPIFVMQVLNRYVVFGVDTTLATLAAGAVVAVVFEFLFRTVRVHLAARAVAPHDERFVSSGLDALTRTPLMVMSVFSSHAHHQAIGGADSIRQAFGPVNLLIFLDLPFSLLFIGVLWILSPLLAIVAAGFAVAVLILSFSSLISLRGPMQQQQSASAMRAQLATAAVKAPETVRMFDSSGLLHRQWNVFQRGLSEAQGAIARNQDFVQTAIQSATALLSVALIGTGAYLVVRGEMNVGVLIGANILGARALMPIAKLGSTFRMLVAAREARTSLDELSRVRRERRDGSELGQYTGAIAFDDVSFAFPNARVPLFEKLSIVVAPGQTLAVVGPNGAGKTTLAQMIAGLREPTRGRVLADGVDVAQLRPDWWRRQVCYLPQEPRFLPGTIKENLLAANPELTDQGISQLLDAAGLRGFVDESADGLGMRITDGGDSLALGIRRRLALARALAVKGRLMIVDEPTEALDEQGRALVYQAMNSHAQAGGTIVACSHDPQILKGADWVIDLSRKPEPRITQLPRAAAGAPTSQEAGE